MISGNSIATLLYHAGRRIGVSAAMATLALTLFSTVTYAAGTITVTTVGDEFDSGGPLSCSVREAIESANTDSDFGGCLRSVYGTPPYDIVIPTPLIPGAYQLTLAGENEDANATGDLDIRASMNIVGGGDAELIIVEAGASTEEGIDRVFHIATDGLTVNFSNITIRHGQVMNDAGDVGGGIANTSNSSVMVESSMVMSNASLGDAANEGGGGLFNGMGGTMLISNSTIAGNHAMVGSGSGGGILNRNGGNLTVVNSEISGNMAARAGGGIEDNGSMTTLENVDLLANSTGAMPGNGGGLHSTGASIVNYMSGMVMDNVASAEGGGLWNSITGTMTIDDVTIVGNIASGAEADQGGGGLFNDGGSLTVTNSTVRNNVADGAAGSGGGILNTAGGTLIVMDSVIEGNSAVRAGGGIEDRGSTTTLTDVNLVSNATGPTPGNGGGLHLTGEGTIMVTGGMVVSNTATAEGGGLWNSITGTMTVENVHIIANIASGAEADQGGGGLFNDGGMLMVSDSTVRDNVADGAAGSGGGILNTAGGTLTVDDTLIQGNSSMRAGGGIEDNASTTTLTHVDLVENATGAAPGNGGGFHSTGASKVSIFSGSVISNMASAEGGGLWNSAAGTMMVDGVLVAGNHADGSGPTRGGGGIFNVGGEMTVSNSTISENSAVQNGGGVKVTGGETVLTNVTLYANSAHGDVSAVVAMTGTITLGNSIVGTMAEQATPLCSANVMAMDHTHNLATDDSCGASLIADTFLGDTSKRWWVSRE